MHASNVFDDFEDVTILKRKQISNDFKKTLPLASSVFFVHTRIVRHAFVVYSRHISIHLPRSSLWIYNLCLCRNGLYMASDMHTIHVSEVISHTNSIIHLYTVDIREGNNIETTTTQLVFIFILFHRLIIAGSVIPVWVNYYQVYHRREYKNSTESAPNEITYYSSILFSRRN